MSTSFGGVRYNSATAARVAAAKAQLAAQPAVQHRDVLVSRAINDYGRVVDGYVVSSRGGDGESRSRHEVATAADVNGILRRNGVHERFTDADLPPRYGGKTESVTTPSHTIVTFVDNSRYILARTIGQPISPTAAAALVGARPGDQVRVTAIGYHIVSLDISSDTYSGHRILGYDENGLLKLANVEFAVDDGHQGRGVGTQVFAREVATATRLGVAYISAMADRSPGRNGYYTWARLGYDGPIPPRVRSQLPNTYASVRTVQDLMSQPGGDAWWKQHGTAWEASFDLTPGSRSHQVLDAYLAEKKIKP